MSTTIDNKVVEMRFDNQHFEKNVQTSLSTLEKLKQSLNLTGAAKGFENIDSAAKRVDMAGLGDAVETVRTKFSALQVMGITALANITNSAVNAGKKIASALTIDPIKTGFQEYETQINAVQTILANTSSKGTTLKDVNKALDTLNTYADKTIYNFTEMTRNIGTFTAAGVDLDTSTKSIQGIANLAAVSGSTSQQASNAMYQLSQALAAGRVSLMDWNSVVNAGMGGQVFQDALKRTATAMGTNVDAMIKKYGSFRESLTQGQWLTTEVLTKTLEQFTMAADEGSDEWNAFKKSLMDEGYTEKQATEILKMANTATDAATKVKTFTQLWDTLKEAAQSGWTQTWEILVGDFEEAKSMLTNVSNVINEMIGESARIRNELLQGWKDAGGRDDILEGFKSMFNGIMALITPVKEAFVDIFPAITVDQLLGFSEGFRELTKRFEEFADSHGDQIYSTFKGIFSILKVGWDIVVDLAGGFVKLISRFTGVSGGILGITGAIGDFLTKIGDSVEESDIFGKSIEKITGFLTGAIDGIKDFGRAVKDNFRAKGFQEFSDFIHGVWDVIRSIGAGAAKMLSPLGESLSSLFDNASLFDVLNSGLLAGAFVAIQKFAGGFKGMFESVFGEDGVLDNAKGILEDVRGCFESYQNNLNASTLMKIAGAIGILAASIFVISSIDAERLDYALGSMAILFGELLGSLALFTKIDPKGLRGVMKAVPMMIGMSVSILILANALKQISSVSWEGLAKGLIGVGVLMAEISLFLGTAELSGNISKSAIGMIAISTALLILAKAVKNFGEMDWNAIGKGLAAIGGLLTELAIFTRLAGNAKHVVSTGISLILLGSAMKIFASAAGDFGGMDWKAIGKGLSAMAGSLAAVTLALRLMPKNMVGMGVGLIAVGAAMKILADSLSDFGSMSWESIGKGLLVMGGALAELAIALNLMTGTLAGSASLIIAAGALAIMTPVLTSLGNMSWGSIAKGLTVLAGAFAIIGAAGYLLAPIVPAIVGLAGSFALFGLSVLGIGAGLTLVGVGLTAIAAGFTALATAGAAGAASFVAALTVIVTGMLNLIPTIVAGFGDIILSLCKVIVECAPQIVETILVVVDEVFKSLATHAPSIIDSLMTFLIGTLDGLATRLPELIVAAVDVISAFFQGVADALSGIDSSSLFKGVIGVALMSGLMLALSAVAGLIPGAMIGVLGMGAVIAELALVLAAIGAISKIPGLSWLVEEGGDFLQKVGTAIGQFVGGIVGGIAEGATSTLPQVGTNLSDFMDNLQPFLNGVKSVDPSTIESVKSLSEAILVLTAANVLDGLTSWFSGGSSLSSFGQELAAFAPYMRTYSENIKGIDATAVEASANAAKALAMMTDTIPNEGGVAAWFAGENSISSFASQLPILGAGLLGFSMSVAGINAENIIAAANAAKALAQMTETIPNEGGMKAWFTGDASITDFADKLPTLGAGLSGFSSAVAGVSPESITAAASAAKSLATMATSAPEDTSTMVSFGDNLVKFGGKLKSYFDKTKDIKASTISTTVDAIRNIKTATIGLNGANITSAATGISALAKSLKSLSGVSEKTVSGFSAAMKKLGETNISAMVSSFSSAGPKMTTAGKNVINKFITGVNSQTSNVSKSGQTVLTKLIDGIKSQEEKSKNACKAIVTSCATAIGGSTSAFYNSGANLVKGFANGISANTWRAEAKARAMANAAAKAAKKALDEHSPSKVFYEIGDYAGLGFVNALDSYGKVAYSSGFDMADSARSGLSNAISKVTDIFNSDINTQPTITPVLDLSEVTAGAGTINSIFGTPSVGIMSKLGRANALVSGNNQNGSNFEVVSAIDKLRRDLGNIGNTTYQINGVTYDDGSNINSAVETIVRAAKIERRV